jgi:pimeloyl-ACP methyl ester carboxylesterase
MWGSPTKPTSPSVSEGENAAPRAVQRRGRRRIWRRAGVSLLFVLGLLVLALTWPVDTTGLHSHPRPAAGYAEAVARIAELQAQDTTAVNPLCRTIVMTHGVRTERVVVFIHGFTNCPEQFRSLGQRLYDRGANVLIARLPYHGLTDRMTPEFARLTARQLASFTDNMVDIAVGLGEHVTLAGLSIGGVAVAWAAQNRADLDSAVAIAPTFAVPGTQWLRRPATRLMLTIPNQFLWWDSRVKASLPGPPYAYPRFSSRALGEVYRLGYAVQDQAGRSRPGAKLIMVVTNAADTAVNHATTSEIIDQWRAHAAREVLTYEFPARDRLHHDMIDPLQPGQRVDYVYPILMELLARG